MGKGIIEYAGYRAPRTTNWDTVLGEVGEDITGVVTKREKQREEDFRIQQETESAINDFTTGVSQDFSDYVSRGVEANRDLMMKYTKMLRSNEINSTQYKRLMNRVNSDWQQFGQFSKDFETRLADMEKRRQAGDSSVIETWNGERIASAADFKNKQLVPNASSGGLYSVSFDKDGKPNKKEIIHMNELNNFRSQLVDKVDLNKTIGAITSKAGDLKAVVGAAPLKSGQGVSEHLAELARQGKIDPQFEKDYNNLIDGIYDAVLTGPPNRVASALADNALNSQGKGFFVYQEGDLEKGGRFEGRSAEDGIKMVQQSDGSWGGELTENQKELLRKKAKQVADSQLGYKEVFMAKDLEEAKFEETKRRNKEAERLARQKEARLADDDGDGDDKETTKVKPYTQLLESFEAKDASRIRSNPKVDDAFYSKNGDELVVILKGTDKTPGTTKTISTTDKEGQKAISRLMNPDLKESKIDELFDADYNTYKEEDRKSVPRDEVVVLEETDFTQKITKKGKKTPSDYSFDDFIKNDVLEDKLTYTKDVALNSGILDLKDIDNLDIEVVDAAKLTESTRFDGEYFFAGTSDDYMKLTYTTPDGKIIESGILNNDPVRGFGDLGKEGNKKMFENFLQELRKEIYFKGETAEVETNESDPAGLGI